MPPSSNLLISATACALILLSTNCEAICPEGYEEGFGTIVCYKYINQVSNWFDANEYCSEDGSWLVAITTPEENEFVTTLSGADKWIGLNDLETPGEWHWTTGFPAEVTYFNWQNTAGSSEIDPDGKDPNVQNPTDVNCTSLQHNTKQWSDRSCSSATGYHFVCQMPNEPTSQPSTAPTLQPTNKPSAPSTMPSSQPSNLPSSFPSSPPSSAPSIVPSGEPSSQPSFQPTSPTSFPSFQPTGVPSQMPSNCPTTQPSTTPSSTPTTLPSTTPTSVPSDTPTSTPTSPSILPTESPSILPTSRPTGDVWGVSGSLDSTESNAMITSLYTILGVSIGGSGLCCFVIFMIFFWYRARKRLKETDGDMKTASEEDIESYSVIIGEGVDGDDKNNNGAIDTKQEKKKKLSKTFSKLFNIRCLTSKSDESTLRGATDHQLPPTPTPTPTPTPKPTPTPTPTPTPNNAPTPHGTAKEVDAPEPEVTGAKACGRDKESKSQRRRDREATKEAAKKAAKKEAEAQDNLPGIPGKTTSFDDAMEDLARIQKRTTDVLNNMNAKERSTYDKGTYDKGSRKQHGDGDSPSRERKERESSRRNKDRETGRSTGTDREGHREGRREGQRDGHDGHRDGHRERESHVSHGQHRDQRSPQHAKDESTEIRPRSSPLMKGLNHPVSAIRVDVEVAASTRQSRNLPKIPKDTFPVFPVSPSVSPSISSSVSKGASLKDKLKNAQTTASVIPMPDRVVRP